MSVFPILIVVLAVAFNPAVIRLRVRYRSGLRVFPRREGASPRDDRWKALEDAHQEECLAALTPEDVAWLKWWSWTPPESVERRIRDLEWAEETARRFEERAKKFAAMDPAERKRHLNGRISAGFDAYGRRRYL